MVARASLLSRLLVTLCFFASSLHASSADAARRKGKKSASQRTAEPVAKPAEVPAAPAPPPETLETALGMYQEARFAESLLLLDKLWQRATNLNEKKAIQTYNALNFLGLKNETRARAAVEALLSLDPDVEAPSMSSPSVRAFFAKVKASYRVIPLIDHVPPREIDDSQGAEITASIERMRPGYMVKLFYRKGERASYSVIDMAKRDGNVYGARVPPALLITDQAETYRFGYYIQVMLEAEVLARVGSPENPLSVPVARKLQLEKPLTQKWWFWTMLAGGVAVAAGAATTGVLLSRPPTAGEVVVNVR